MTFQVYHGWLKPDNKLAIFVHLQLRVGLPACQQGIYTRCDMRMNSPAVVGQNFNQASEHRCPSPFSLCFTARVALPAGSKRSLAWQELVILNTLLTAFPKLID